jgi:hypothetical protein
LTDLEALKADRQEVYGDPIENHKGIAQMWACLLQPHAERIARMEPLPEHVIALMMVGLKLNRMRRRFKQDNYDDLRVYLGFAEGWQGNHDELASTAHQTPHRNRGDAVGSRDGGDGRHGVSGTGQQGCTGSIDSRPATQTA